MKKIVQTSLIVLAAGACLGAGPKPVELAFVACPILRDTATVPCWLTEYKGQMYYLGIQEDSAAQVYPPALGHQALIEGTVTGEEICGGKVLKPLKISIRPELDPTCNTLLPASDTHKITFNRRGPGPNVARPPGGGGRGPAPEAPKPPFAVKDVPILFDFDVMTPGRSGRAIREAFDYITASKPRKVEIRGYRAAVKLSDGKVLAEQPFVAERRAKELAGTFETLGVPKESIVVSWSDKAEVGDFNKRRVVVTIRP